jgi:hypothetical protein
VLEALLAVTATGGLVALARGRRRDSPGPILQLTVDPGDDDLPCPWCFTSTRAEDSRCPGCLRRFG